MANLSKSGQITGKFLAPWIKNQQIPMAKAKAFLDTRRVLKDGTYPLVLRIRRNKNRRDIKLNIYLKEEEFDSTNQKVIRGHPNEKEINQRIRQAVLEVEKTALNFELKEEVISVEKIKNTILKPVPKLNFVQFGRKLSEDMRLVNRIGNATAYRDAITALITYSGKSDLQFQDVTYEFLCSVENKMLAKGLKRNSIAAYNRAWRAVYNRAINEDLIDSKHYPYRKYKVKGEGTAKRNIAKEDIIAIANLDLTEGNPLWHSRNYFLLSFNLRGISFTDMASIRPGDIVNGRLLYKRKKTHKLYNVKLTDKAKEILSYYQQPGKPYILPFLNDYVKTDPTKQMLVVRQAIKITNKYLKRIGEMLNLPIVLSTYVARHSHATIAKRLGYSKDLISESLGHSNGSSITEIYLGSYDLETIDAMNEAVCKI